jgi:hypothetical protein
MAHLLVLTDCTAAVQQQLISGHISQNSVQSVQSVRYSCLCTFFEVAVVGFLPVHFKHGNRREEISNCCWFIFADVISIFEERRTPSLSLVFPTLGFFQGRFDQNYLCHLNVCLLSYFLSF